MKIFTIPILLSMSFVCNASYVVEDISDNTTKLVCGDEVKPGDTIVIASNGGVVNAAYETGICIRDKGIKLQVMKAVSAAPYLVLFSDNVCMLDTVDLAVHTPYFDINNVTLEETREVMLSIIGTLVREAKIPLPVALELAAYMFLTPSKELRRIPSSVYIRMLGDKYKGQCIDISLK